jgi:hypothetical protein
MSSLVYFQLLPYPFLNRGQRHLGTIEKQIHLFIEENPVFAFPKYDLKQSYMKAIDLLTG